MEHFLDMTMELTSTVCFLTESVMTGIPGLVMAAIRPATWSLHQHLCRRRRPSLFLLRSPLRPSLYRSQFPLRPSRFPSLFLLRFPLRPSLYPSLFLPQSLLPLNRQRLSVRRAALSLRIVPCAAQRRAENAEENVASACRVDVTTAAWVPFWKLPASAAPRHLLVSCKLPQLNQAYTRGWISSCAGDWLAAAAAPENCSFAKR